jgi:hypothetical protein
MTVSGTTENTARLGLLDPETGNVYLPSGKLGAPVAQ